MFKYIIFAIIIILVIRALLRVKANNRPAKMRYPIRTGESQRLKVFIKKDAPTRCLVNHGKAFGPNFKDKVPPVLCVGCSCDFVQINPGYKDYASEDKGTLNPSDLGELNSQETKYYLASILESRDDLDGQAKTFWAERKGNQLVSEEFKIKVNEHLYKLTSLNSSQ